MNGAEQVDSRRGEGPLALAQIRACYLEPADGHRPDLLGHVQMPWVCCGHAADHSPQARVWELRRWGQRPLSMCVPRDPILFHLSSPAFLLASFTWLSRQARAKGK